MSALDFDRGSCLCGDCRVRRAHRDARSSQTMDERWKAAQTALVYMLAKRKQPDTGAGKALSITAALARRSRDELWTTAGGRPKDSSKQGGTSQSGKSLSLGTRVQAGTRPPPVDGPIGSLRESTATVATNTRHQNANSTGATRYFWRPVSAPSGRDTQLHKMIQICLTQTQR